MIKSLKKFLLLAGVGAMSLNAAVAQVNVSINIAPPELPVYEQPPCPTEGYLWSPGYWGYADEGYYWVPGVWVEPPQVGFLWTPGYWGYRNGLYAFNDGYWGPTVGFYGGVNYGYGYDGRGYYGGRWDGGAFRYNTAVSRVDTTIIHNTYIDKTVVRDGAPRGASFNGPGGIKSQPTGEELAAARGSHVQPTSLQAQHAQEAAHNRQLLASVNHGHPAQAAIHSTQPQTHVGTPAQDSHAGAPRENGPQARTANAGGQPFNDAREAHPNRDGLSADERQVLTHRQQRLDRANAETRETASRSREGYEQGASRRDVEGRNLAREATPGRGQPVVHQSAPVEKRHAEKPEGGKSGDKRDKNDKKHSQPQ